MTDVTGKTKSAGYIWPTALVLLMVFVVARPYLMGGLDGWGTDLAAAKDQAKQAGKPVLLYFDAPG